MKYLPSIAFGTWSWGTGAIGGDQVFGNSFSEEELRPVFEASIKQGDALWDTATAYGMGASEDILGSFVAEYGRDRIILSTKFTPQIATDSQNAVEEMLDASLERLQTDYVDIYWIHNPADVERWTPALVSLLKKGKVKRVGVSNHNLEQIKRVEEILSAGGFHLNAVQNHYSLLYRECEEAGIIDYCKEKGIAFFAYMVLEQGALSGKYDTKNPMPKDSMRGSVYNPQIEKIESLISVMKHIAEAHEATIPQIAIAWAIAKGTLPLVGATKIHHVEEALVAASIELKQEEVEMIESAATVTGAETRGSWEASMV